MIGEAEEKEYAPWIGVDLDGTLAKELPEFDPEKIGEPLAPMMRLVKMWIRKGKTVKILTARAANSANVPPIKAWLKQHGLEGVEVTNEKDPGMTEIWDDRAVEVERNVGTVAEAIIGV